MKRRADRHADEDEAYRLLRWQLLPGPCLAGPKLAELNLVLAGRCTKDATELHHLRKRSSAGALANPANVVPVCHACNMAIEDYPVAARAAGLVVREGDPEWEALSARSWRQQQRSAS